MDNILIFNGMQAIIINPDLLKKIKEEEAKNKKFEEKMDKEIKKSRQ